MCATNKIQSETARRSYIRLLQMFSSSNSLNVLKPCDWELASELITGGFLKGTFDGYGVGSTMPAGSIMCIMVTGITVEGRLFLQRLIAEESEHSLRTKVFKYGQHALTFLAGLLSPVLVKWLEKLIGP